MRQKPFLPIIVLISIALASCSSQRTENEQEEQELLEQINLLVDQCYPKPGTPVSEVAKIWTIREYGSLPPQKQLRGIFIPSGEKSRGRRAYIVITTYRKDPGKPFMAIGDQEERYVQAADPNIAIESDKILIHKGKDRLPELRSRKQYLQYTLFWLQKLAAHLNKPKTEAQAETEGA